MKKLITNSALIFVFSILFSSKSNAQITYEATYPSGGTNFMYMVNLEISGNKYVVKSQEQNNRYIKLYNLDHSLWKTINCNTFFFSPTNCSPFNPTADYQFQAVYISETLFDCDPEVEFLFQASSSCYAFVGIYKEDGTMLFEADSLMIKNTLELFPRKAIYNTPNGTKMILRSINGDAKVYDLPCLLSPNIENSNTVGIDGLSSDSPSGMIVYPNPSENATTINYSFPEGKTEGEIIIRDLNGKEIKRFQVDTNFSSIIIENNLISSGTYLYSFEIDNQIIETKKVILK